MQTWPYNFLPKVTFSTVDVNGIYFAVFENGPQGPHERETSVICPLVEKLYSWLWPCATCDHVTVNLVTSFYVYEERTDVLQAQTER